MSSVRLKVIAAATVCLITATGAASAFAAHVVPDWGGLPPPPPPPPPPAASIPASSVGTAMNITFTVNGQASRLTNQVMASGSSAQAAYNKKTSVPTYSKTTAFKGGVTLTGDTRTLTSIASATAANSAGQRTANASAEMNSVSLTVKNGSAVLMTLTSTKLSSKASFLTTKTAKTPAGNTQISGLVINSTAFGAKNVKFSGTPLANKVLFKSKDGTVIIYGDRKTITSAAGKPSKVEVDGISVQFDHFKNAGKTITGNIKLATSIAD